MGQAGNASWPSPIPESIWDRAWRFQLRWILVILLDFKITCKYTILRRYTSFLLLLPTNSPILPGLTHKNPDLSLCTGEGEGEGAGIKSRITKTRENRE